MIILTLLLAILTIVNVVNNDYIHATYDLILCSWLTIMIKLDEIKKEVSNANSK